MSMRLKIASAVVLVAVGAGTALVTMSASGQSGWSAEDGRSAIHRAFPSAVDTSVDPGLRGDGTIVAQARIHDSGADWGIAATDQKSICLSAEGTTTCQPGAAVAQSGIFVAAVNCQTKTVDLEGLAPADVRRITAQGSESTTVTTTDQGIVRASLPGSVDGLSLDNGASNPFRLDLATICGPRRAAHGG